jgi:hypothetical protein
MRARLISDTPFKNTTACGGLVFTKTAWTDVPPHEERSAQANALLEIEATDDPGDTPKAKPKAVAKKGSTP